MTRIGVILGTAAYMSPEQARGKPVDRRADIWAFGVTLFEMLTGHQLFDGETVSDTLASVLKNEPDWNLLPLDTPAAIRRLLRRCLGRIHRKRLSSAADASIEIDESLGAPSAEMPIRRERPRWLYAKIIVAMLLVAIFAALATWRVMRPALTSPPVMARFEVLSALPLAVSTRSRCGALSRWQVARLPNDDRRPFGTFGSGGGAPWAIRRLDALDARLIAGITRGRSLFFSSDSRWIGFFDTTELKRVSVDGGTPSTICAYTGLPRGASWAEDETIVFATNNPESNRGLLRVPAGGGTPAYSRLWMPHTARSGTGFHRCCPAGEGCYSRSHQGAQTHCK